MISDDPRLSLLIRDGKDGDIIVVGAPFDYCRRRTLGKGGEDNGPCCVRRFFPKVGPLANPEYGISIKHLNVTDYGNISVVAENQTVAPERAISRIHEQVHEMIKNNKLPFVFGGSKEAAYGSALALRQSYPENHHHILIAGRPTLKRPFDGSKLTSDNLITLLQSHNQHNLTVFGMSKRYLPQQQVLELQQISYQQIRKHQTCQQDYINTQGGSAFTELLKKHTSKKLQVSLSVQAIQRFRGCRDVLAYGLTVEQMMEIFFWCGMCKDVKIVDICEFNPSVEDYESSLILVNLLYYFLMGWTKRPLQQNEPMK